MKVGGWILIGVLCSGCSSQPVENNTYLLQHPGSATTRTATAPPSVALGRVEVAPYLDQDGIVLETAPNEIKAARHHAWAEPLSYSIRRYLRAAIGQAADTNVAGAAADTAAVEKRIDVSVHQLHGTLSGEVRLVAEWWLLNGKTGEVLGHRELSLSEPLASDGYPGVVNAHQTLLDLLAESIAEGLRSSE